MDYSKLSDKQVEILKFIKETILGKGYPPSLREIGEACHLKSPSSVHNHLSKLEELGLIRRDASKTRALEIVDEDFNPSRREMVSVPIIGNVAAGEPIFARQNISDYFPIPVEYLPNKTTFMLIVRGESMINVGIYNGDYILAEKTNVARNGDTVVALVDDCATVKTFYKEQGYFRLQPENDYMEPIILENVEILGKVIGVFRFF